MRHASLIQSAPGKHRARESVPTGKEVSDDKRPPHLGNPENPGNPRFRQTKMDRHRAYPHHTGKSALTKRAYRGVKRALANRAYPVHRDREVSPTGDLS